MMGTENRMMKKNDAAATMTTTTTSGCAVVAGNKKSEQQHHHPLLKSIFESKGGIESIIKEFDARKNQANGKHSIKKAGHFTPKQNEVARRKGPPPRAQSLQHALPVTTTKSQVALQGGKEEQALPPSPSERMAPGRAQSLQSPVRSSKKTPVALITTQSKAEDGKQEQLMSPRRKALAGLSEKPSQQQQQQSPAKRKSPVRSQSLQHQQQPQQQQPQQQQPPQLLPLSPRRAHSNDLDAMRSPKKKKPANAATGSTTAETAVVSPNSATSSLQKSKVLQDAAAAAASPAKKKTSVSPEKKNRKNKDKLMSPQKTSASKAQVDIAFATLKKEKRPSVAAPPLTNNPGPRTSTVQTEEAPLPPTRERRKTSTSTVNEKAMSPKRERKTLTSKGKEGAPAPPHSPSYNVESASLFAPLPTPSTPPASPRREVLPLPRPLSPDKMDRYNNNSSTVVQSSLPGLPTLSSSPNPTKKEKVDLMTESSSINTRSSPTRKYRSRNPPAPSSSSSSSRAASPLKKASSQDDSQTEQSPLPVLPVAAKTADKQRQASAAAPLSPRKESAVEIPTTEQQDNATGSPTRRQFRSRQPPAPWQSSPKKEMKQNAEQELPDPPTVDMSERPISNSNSSSSNAVRQLSMETAKTDNCRHGRKKDKATYTVRTGCNNSPRRRPDICVRVGSSALNVYNRKLRHDDCVLVPELFGPEEDFSIYHRVYNDLTPGLQKPNNVAGTTKSCSSRSGGGRHMTIGKPGRSSPAVIEIIAKMVKYFSIRNDTMKFKLDWYRENDSDSTPPSGQFPDETLEQETGTAIDASNITVLASFGAEREMALEKGGINVGEDGKSTTLVHVAQTNNGVCSIGRDVNVRFKHSSISASTDPEANQSGGAVNGRGRLCVTLWGYTDNALDE